MGKNSVFVLACIGHMLVGDASAIVSGDEVLGHRQSSAAKPLEEIQEIRHRSYDFFQESSYEKPSFSDALLHRFPILRKLYARKQILQYQECLVKSMIEARSGLLEYPEECAAHLPLRDEEKQLLSHAIVFNFNDETILNFSSFIVGQSSTGDITLSLDREGHAYVRKSFAFPTRFSWSLQQDIIDESKIANFKMAVAREIRAHKKVSHEDQAWEVKPYIPVDPVAGDSISLFIPYLGHQTLSYWLSALEVPPPLWQVVGGPLGEVATDLQRIHRQGIAHLDMKPQNMMTWVKNGKLHVKIIDFGVSMPYDEKLEYETGTLETMAPEVANSEFRKTFYEGHLEGFLDLRKADVWSLAMTWLMASSNEATGVTRSCFQRYSQDRSIRDLAQIQYAFAFEVGKTLDPENPTNLCKVCGLYCDPKNSRRIKKPKSLPGEPSSPSLVAEQLIFDMLNPDPGKRPDIDEVVERRRLIQKLVESDRVSADQRAIPPIKPAVVLKPFDHRPPVFVRKLAPISAVLLDGNRLIKAKAGKRNLLFRN